MLHVRHVFLLCYIYRQFTLYHIHIFCITKPSIQQTPPPPLPSNLFYSLTFQRQTFCSILDSIDFFLTYCLVDDYVVMIFLSFFRMLSLFCPLILPFLQPSLTYFFRCHFLVMPLFFPPLPPRPPLANDIQHTDGKLPLYFLLHFVFPPFPPSFPPTPFFSPLCACVVSPHNKKKSPTQQQHSKKKHI